ncbi:MAG: metallopeptidase family protein, partial [Pseudomonadota bacterium]
MSLDPDLAELVDALVADAIDTLPEPVLRRLEEVPVVLLDEPDPRMASDVGLDLSVARDELCGLHSGIALTARTIEETAAPDVIHLFRRGLLLRADDLAAERPTAAF